LTFHTLAEIRGVAPEERPRTEVWGWHPTIIRGKRRTTFVATVGVVGFGTVGTGVARLLLAEREALASKLTEPIRLKWVCDVDLDRPRDVAVPPECLTRDYRQVVQDPDVDIVAELIGGTGVAREVVLSAVRTGKDVVTANKALLAVQGEELFAAAESAGVSISFEASCAGGVPVIAAIRDGFIANRIQSIRGIVNGTANYILSKMTREGTSYSQALAEAQAHGYAEDPPTLDVAGTDSAHKLAILARLGFGVAFDFEAISVEGIEGIDQADVQFAGEMGYVIKLLAVARRTEEGLDLRVHPALVSCEDPLASVHGVTNAVAVEGHAVGRVLLIGRGAGQMPTASAVVADIVDAALGRSRITFRRLTAFNGGAPRAAVLPAGRSRSRHYFRFTVLDAPGVLAQIAGVLGRYGISIASVVQHEAAGDEPVPVIIMAHEADEASVREALAVIDDLDVVRLPTVWLRVEDDQRAEPTKAGADR
jgi:homoserine dehydrogenase